MTKSKTLKTITWTRSCLHFYEGKIKKIYESEIKQIYESEIKQRYRNKVQFVRFH